MDDLLQSQIQDGCRLALPEGLKDLMSDISREVLRAQPKNLLEFITDYLSVMLVTRENLNAAAQICDDVCENMHAVSLEDELREKDIDDEDIETIKELVNKHFMAMGPENPVKESHLMSKIIQKTSIDEDKFVDVVDAVRNACLRYQANNTTIYELTPDSSMDDITRAAHHTIDLYRKTKPTDDDFNQAAENIQAAYRAYGVRRQKKTEISKIEWSYAPEIIKRSELEDTKEIYYDADLNLQHNITFDAEVEGSGLEDTKDIDKDADLNLQHNITFDAEAEHSGLEDTKDIDNDADLNLQHNTTFDAEAEPSGLEDTKDIDNDADLNLQHNTTFDTEAERSGLEDTNEIYYDADLKIQHNITFDAEADDGNQDGYHADTESRFADSRSIATVASEKTDDIYVFPLRVSTASSATLAGSYVNLPKHKPYAVCDESINETVEPAGSAESIKETVEPAGSAGSIKETVEPAGLAGSIKETVEPVGSAGSLDPEEANEKQKLGHFNVDYTKENSIEARDEILDYESEDIGSGSSIEEEIDEDGERKVLFNTSAELQSQSPSSNDIDN